MTTAFLIYVYHFLVPSRTPRKGMQKTALLTDQNKPVHCRGAVRSFFRVYDNLYMAFFHGDQAKVLARHELKSNFLVVPILMEDQYRLCEGGSSSSNMEHNAFSPSSLTEIFKFDEMACALERNNTKTRLVFCTGGSHASQARLAFLVGCHMMMSHGTTLDDTIQYFRNLHGLFHQFASTNGGNVSVQSCWRALSSARSLHWIDFRKVPIHSPQTLFAKPINPSVFPSDRPSIHLLVYLCS